MRTVVASIGVALGAGVAGAQTGVQDQVSPILFQPWAAWARFYFPGAETTWRQQVRVGTAGQLEGVKLGLIGDPGEGCTLRVRWGTAASPGLILATATVTKTAPGDEILFVDLTGDEINLVPGNTIVLELQRLDPWPAIAGNYMAPPSAPLYPEPLYYGDNPSVAGWRIGFETFMLEECRADLTRSAVPGSFGYGVPNGTLNNEDFFYYLAIFAAEDRGADLTHTAIPGTPGYGQRDGIVNNDDFFYYLSIFSAGC